MNSAVALSRAIFGEEHNIYRQSVRRFIEKSVSPHYERWEREGQVPRSFWTDAGGAGLLCPMVP
ncbi:MAG: acyl-CoA dehydrogenase, partial [Alphaproteobacteria bacterium]|nr:acyl-CoA dehydrogenase [Alphaproteobacteria bacterium]